LFEKGKKVQLKGGGPVMTVQRIGKFSPGAVDGVDCMWFDERHKRCRAVFQAASLRLIDAAIPSDASHGRPAMTLGACSSNAVAHT
jgi:uncharacterized protein YodC (DUF2158 family)